MSVSRATILSVEAAFFDLDKTIIARSTGLALGRTFLNAGLIARTTFLKSAYAGILFQLIGANEARMERMRARAAHLTAGWEAEKVRSVVEAVLDDVFTPLMYAEAIELLDQHRAAGRLLCIVSTSPEEVVQPLARMLKVDRFIATRSRIVGGVYTGELDFYAFGTAKATAVKEMAAELEVDLAASFAYSDSVTDLPMLESVGKPVAVNPDKALKRVAVQRGWPVLAFRRPVHAGTPLARFKPHRRTVGGTLAAAALAVGVATATWWLIKKNSERLV